MRNDVKSNGLTMGHRDPTRNPFSGSCQLHLRRVCGVCAQFRGELRGEGQCVLLALTMRGGRDARDCEFWVRKVARGGC